MRCAVPGGLSRGSRPTERLSNSGMVTIGTLWGDTQQKDSPGSPWHVGWAAAWCLRRLRAWCLRPHPSSPARVGNVRLGLVPPGWWASLHGRGTLLTVSGALVVHGTCAQPLEFDVQSTNAGGSGPPPGR